MTHLKLPAAARNGDQVAVQQVVWLNTVPLHGGVDLKRCIKVGAVISHARIDRRRVQLRTHSEAGADRQTGSRQVQGVRE